MTMQCSGDRSKLGEIFKAYKNHNEPGFTVALYRSKLDEIFKNRDGNGFTEASCCDWSLIVTSYPGAKLLS